MRQRLCSVIVAGAALLGACRRSEPHQVTNAFQWSDQIPAGGTVHLRDLNGQMRVVPAATPTVQITGSKLWHRGRESDVQFVANRVGNDVYVCAVWGRRTRCDERGYTARGPSFWRIFSLHGRSDMRADFDLSLPPGVKLDILSINGSANVTGISSDLTIKAVNGSVSAHSRSGAMKIEVVNGSITAGVDSLTTTAPLQFTTVNGSVHVTLPAAFQGRVTMQTVTGRASTDFPVTGTLQRNGIVGLVGSGSASVSLKTVNGSVDLRRKG